VIVIVASGLQHLVLGLVIPIFRPSVMSCRRQPG
jgi:hypothetical protein